MSRWFPTSLVLCAALIAGASRSATIAHAQTTAIAPAPLTVVGVYDAWMDGDHQVIARTFPDAQAFRAMREDLQRTLRQWVRAWTPSQAAFLLELSFVAFDRQWSDAADLLGGTRNLVVSRRAPPGTNEAEDAFERDFHRAAVTFFLGRQLLRPANDYLNALAGRVDLAPATAGTPRLVDPWMAFARGLVTEIATAPAVGGNGRSGDGPARLAIAPTDTATRRQAELALNEYTRVRHIAAVAAEAEVRRGLLLARLGRPDDALAALDAAERADGDAPVRYWTWLFRGRVLEDLGRVTDAAAAYERAAAIVPTAQTPAVALASLWQRHDRPDEALRWATRAMSTPAGSVDPWWLYWHGDARFSTDRLAALRRVRP